MEKTRVLMLCGSTQNGAIWGGKMKSITESLPQLEMVFIDPPHELKGTEQTITVLADNSVEFVTPSIPDDGGLHDNRTWYSYKTVSGKLVSQDKFHESMIYLRDYLEENEPFDAVWGYCQGASMAGPLMRVLEDPSIHPAFDGRERVIQPFKFGILSSGYLPLEKKLINQFYSEDIEAPTLHTIGEADAIVPPEYSENLACKFAEARVCYHDGGHHAPSKQAWLEFYNNWINDTLKGESTESQESPV